MGPSSGSIARNGGGYRGYGSHVVIRNDDNTYDLYSHLHLGSIPSNIQVNARVGIGQSFGIMGNTGESTSAHLHFERRTQPSTYSSSIKVDFFDDLSAGTFDGERWTSSTPYQGAPPPPGDDPPPPPPSTDPRLVLLIFDPQFYLATY